MGSAVAFAVMLKGVVIGSCPPNFMCLSSYEFYSMRLDMWSGLAALIGLSLLLAAFKELLISLRPVELLDRNIESIADLN